MIQQSVNSISNGFGIQRLLESPLPYTNDDSDIDNKSPLTNSQIRGPEPITSYKSSQMDELTSSLNKFDKISQNSTLRDPPEDVTAKAIEAVSQFLNQQKCRQSNNGGSENTDHGLYNF